MRRSDSFDFTLDEETEKRLYDLLTDMDTRNTNRFWITDKRGYHAEYAKVIRCKDCKYWYAGENINYCRKFWDDDGEPKLYRCTVDDFCSRAERKE